MRVSGWVGSAVLCCALVACDEADTDGRVDVEQVDAGEFASDGGVRSDAATAPADGSSTPAHDGSTSADGSYAADAHVVQVDAASNQHKGDAGDAGWPALPVDDAGLQVVTIEDLQERIFNGSGFCSSCHLRDGVMAVPDLSSAAASYRSLLVNAPGPCRRTYVVPGDLGASFLYEITTAAKPSCGLRMPLGGHLKEADVQLIEDWILGGARRR